MGRLAGIAMAVFGLSALAGVASAAEYPSKPVRLVVPFGPGGATDITSRSMAPKLGDLLGQQVVVDNRPGGGGVIGTSLVAQSAPDGHTMLMATIGFAANKALYSKLPYDPATDFAAVSLVAIVPTILAVHPSVPARSAKELLALAKARPGALNFGSAGSGTINHLAGELVRYHMRLDIVHVPYKSGGQVVAALVSGEVSMVFATTPTSLGYIKAGKLIPLAVSGTRRVSALPEVPPLADTIPGFDAVEWQGLVVAGATPKAIIDRLYKETVATLKDPAVRERIIGTGADVVGGTPAEFDAHIRTEIGKWLKVAKETGMKTE